MNSIDAVQKNITKNKDIDKVFRKKKIIDNNSPDVEYFGCEKSKCEIMKEYFGL